jgi:hypothetical protein
MQNVECPRHEPTTFKALQSQRSQTREAEIVPYLYPCQCDSYTFMRLMDEKDGESVLFSILERCRDVSSPARPPKRSAGGLAELKTPCKYRGFLLLFLGLYLPAHPKCFLFNHCRCEDLKSSLDCQFSTQHPVTFPATFSPVLLALQ